MILFKRKKDESIYTLNITSEDITLDDIRAVFFPKNFSEKYRYLGNIPYNTDSEIFKAMLPLILTMDYEAKPKWCPRWLLRFLFLFGSDNSIVRVRNWKLHNLFQKLTKGIMIWSWKTKWEWYDLRISVSGPDYLMNLADDIEKNFYERNKPKDEKK